MFSLLRIAQTFSIFCLLTTSIFAQEVTVGVSWSNFRAERWLSDEAAIKAALAAVDIKYVATNAKSSVAQQIADIEELVAQNVDAMIVLSGDSEALLPAIKRVTDQDIPVIAYDRLIENPSAFYVTFDNREVGRIQARALFSRQPTGNYAFINGAKEDPNTGFVFDGQIDVLLDALSAGSIVNVGAVMIDSWSTEGAKHQMTRMLDANDNKVDAVVASNDETALGVIQALEERGLAGKVFVSGQDAEKTALNNIALGKQTVTVWKDAHELGRRAGELAAYLAAGGAQDSVAGAIKYSGGRQGVEVNALFLSPRPITRETLDIVIDAGWAEKAEVCAGVAPQTLPVCD